MESWVDDLTVEQTFWGQQHEFLGQFSLEFESSLSVNLKNRHQLKKHKFESYKTYATKKKQIQKTFGISKDQI